MDLLNENIIHVKNKNIEYLQFKKLLQYPEIKYAYVIGLDKNFKIFLEPKNDEEKIKNNLSKKSYKEICDELNIKYKNIVNTDQSHTDNIQIIKNKINNDKPDFNLYKNTDGLITNKKNIILSTINADCILLVFYDPIKKVIANVHSGWRGTIKRISVKTIEKMKEEYNCNPQDIICCMSPSIRKCHFEVDNDVYQIFKNEKKKKKNFDELAIKNNDKWNIDTIEINRTILKNAGLKKENIIDSGICSVCNKNIIHSYRGMGEEAGRATQIISLI